MCPSDIISSCRLLPHEWGGGGGIFMVTNLASFRDSHATRPRRKNLNMEYRSVNFVLSKAVKLRAEYSERLFHINTHYYSDTSINPNHLSNILN